MKKSIITAVIFTIIMLTCTLPARADSDRIPEIHDTDTSFSEEGAKAYDNLQQKIWDGTDELIERATNGQAVGDVESGLLDIMEKDPVKSVWVYIFYIYDVFSSIYPALLIFSITLGVILAVLSSKNKARKKFAIVVLCVIIPVISTLFVYATPYLYLKFA